MNNELILADENDRGKEGANQAPYEDHKENPKQAEYFGDESTIALKKLMVKRLEETLGLVTSAAKKAKIHRSTHYDWLKQDPLYKEHVDAVQDLTLDFVETMQLKRIKEGSDVLIKWYLATKGKGRGYQEAAKTVHVGGEPGGEPVKHDHTLKVEVVTSGAPLASSEKEVIDALGLTPEEMGDEDQDQ